MNRSLLGLLVISIVLFHCSSDSCREHPDIDPAKIELQVERLEEIMFDLDSKPAVAKFLQSKPSLVWEFLGRAQYAHDSVLVNNILRLSKDPYVDTLRLETRRIFGDFSGIEEEFQQAFAYLRFYYPEAQLPKIQTVITGFGQDLFVSDSVIIIGLDYFLGPTAKYRPLDYPDYIQARFSKEFIVPSCILHLSKIYNQTDFQDKTLLADMIFFGKSYYMVERILPCTHDSLIVQYTSQQISDITENKDIIWANFVQQQLLYETSHFVKNKFIGERPSVPEIGDKCPGRIGAWVGWEIVRSYMRENGSSLPELMANHDASEVFGLSGYKP